MCLYDSRIEDIDELDNLKNIMQSIHNGDQATYTRLMSGVANPDQLNKF